MAPMNHASLKISVVLPNFNRGDLLPETLDSLLCQGFSNWEAIVVDDGSNDNSLDIVRSYASADPRIRLILRDREPGGAPVCRNIGTEQASGDYLIFLDSDDILMPGALSGRAQVILDNPEWDFWVFPMLMFRNSPAEARFLWNIDNGSPDLHRFLLLDAPWQTTGPIWRRDAVLRAGGFTEGLACWQDVDFHLKALIHGLKGKKWYTMPPDALYRQHEIQSISQGEISSPAKLESRFRIFSSHAEALQAFPRELMPEQFGMTSGQVMADISILGGNIAIGAARALNRQVFSKVVGFGVGQGVFNWWMALRLYTVMIFFLFRLNRIGLADHFLRNLTKRFRQDQNIGKHPYQPQSHG